MALPFRFVLVLLVLLAPMAAGHLLVGAPNVECESAFWKHYHDYGGSLAGLASGPSVDGAAATWCGDGYGDGHRDHAWGGAQFTVAAPADPSCNPDVPDHSPYALFEVYDVLLVDQVEFYVAADSENVLGGPCGDGLPESWEPCFSRCYAPFPPGLDGTFLVYVKAGTTGHVVMGHASP